MLNSPYTWNYRFKSKGQFTYNCKAKILTMAKHSRVYPNYWSKNGTQMNKKFKYTILQTTGHKSLKHNGQFHNYTHDARIAKIFQRGGGLDFIQDVGGMLSVEHVKQH